MKNAVVFGVEISGKSLVGNKFDKRDMLDALVHRMPTQAQSRFDRLKALWSASVRAGYLVLGSQDGVNTVTLANPSSCPDFEQYWRLLFWRTPQGEVCLPGKNIGHALVVWAGNGETVSSQVAYLDVSDFKLGILPGGPFVFTYELDEVGALKQLTPIIVSWRATGTITSCTATVFQHMSRMGHLEQLMEIEEAVPKILEHQDRVVPSIEPDLLRSVLVKVGARGMIRFELDNLTIQ